MGKLTVLSLGWGVQSWTLAAMMALDEIPRADYVIHADTTYELSQTYEFASKWTPWLGERGVTVHTVTGNRNGVVLQEKNSAVMIPAFTTDANGNAGQVRRQCTGDWKIMPIRRFVRAEMERLEIKIAPGVVRMQTGITTDEIHRMRDSDVRYIENEYPLIDMGMSRLDCAFWLEKNNLSVPHKSACTFCPYSSRRRWHELKREAGADWAQAVEVDIAIREKRGAQLLATYVHSARMPLTEAVKIPEDVGASQPAFDGFEECESGFCWT
tara:strand:+ start:193 stop:999 length:807 start_codon:yes stop_codon:yes gene_type:complete